MTNPETPEDSVSTAPAGESGAQPAEPIGAPAPITSADGRSGKKWLIGGAVAAGAAIFLVGFGSGYITGDQVGGSGDRHRGISQDGRDRGGDPMMIGPRDGRGPGSPGQRGRAPDLPVPDERQQQAPTTENQEPAQEPATGS